MQTKLLCLDDAYQKECAARVVETDGNSLVLDQTVFFYIGGGYPGDLGTISKDGNSYKVVEVSKRDGKIFHKVEGGSFQAGDEVNCELDWERRHKLIRMHTSAHMLGAVMYKKGALVTGNQLGVDQTRFDYNCPTGMQREMFDEGIRELNELLTQDINVKIYSLPREEAMKIEGIIKFARGGRLPPDIPVWRIVEVPGVDVQADGGPHVKNVREIGQARIEKIENKGATNKRLYYSLTG